MNNGYHALAAGKVYHFGADYKTGWSESNYAPKEGASKDHPWVGRGYLSEEGQRLASEHDRKHQRGRRGMGPAFEAPDVADGEYPDGRTAQYAIRQLNRLKDQPFFMAVGFSKPHLPFNAPKKYWDLYDEEDIALADNPFAPGGAPPQAVTEWGELRGYYGMPKEGPMPDDLARKLIHGYYACTSYADALIGSLLDELDLLGLAENTVVVLWGDHGWSLGEKDEWSKFTLWEESTRAPLIWRVPGMTEGGALCQRAVDFTCLYPTLCELAGVQTPGHVEGVSIAPLLRDPAAAWDGVAVTTQGYRSHAVRTERWRYIRYADGGEELYDHDADEYEWTNLAGDPAYASEMERLREYLPPNNAPMKP